jgi:integrase
VNLEDADGRLRLRWTHQGQRYCLSVGLPDSKANRLVARNKANRIESEIAHDLFDPTLKRYRADHDRRDALTVVQLFQKFKVAKTKEVHPRTLQKYDAVLNHLGLASIAKTRIDALSTEALERTYTYLMETVSPRTAKELLGLVSACWKWAIDQELIQKNPWPPLVRWIKSQPRQRPKPFTSEEIQAILEAFRTDTRWSCYYPFVLFLFCSGCRISEAIGLRWQDLNDDCSQAWIGTSLVRGKRKSTKTNRDRTIGLPVEVSTLLLAIKPQAVDSQSLVFKSPDGKVISDGNFRS